MVARAHAELNAGRIDEAEDLFDELGRVFPRHPGGPVGAALVSMKREHWQDALMRWDAVLERFTENPSAASWKVSRAHVLARLNLVSEAETSFRQALQADASSTPALLGLLQILNRSGRSKEALAVLKASDLCEAGTAASIGQHLDVNIRLKQFQQARDIYSRSLAAANRVDVLTCLFNFAPEFYEGAQLEHQRLSLWDKLQGLEPKGDAEAIQIAVLRARIRLAVKDERGFLDIMSRFDAKARLGRWERLLRAAARAISQPGYPDYGKPKIFGIGLSKTGTTTLAEALNQLGFATLDWRNLVTFDLISDYDVPIFDAFTDTTVAVRYEKDYFAFPNAKFIYTTRPLESWLPSMTDYFTRQYGVSSFAEAKDAMTRPDTFHYGTGFRELHAHLYYRHASYEDAYRAHDERVRNFFADKPPGRFLEFDVFAGDGWEKLCSFVGVPVPDCPFPWANRRPPAQ